MATVADRGVTWMSLIKEFSTEAGATSTRGLILVEAGTSRAASEEIMAQLVRVVLWSIVVVAPGGLLLLPFLAVHQFSKNQKSSSSPSVESRPSP